MLNHTPGPWTVRGPTQHVNQIAIDPAIGCAYGAGDEVLANAALMAAAPDLAAALRDLLDDYEGTACEWSGESYARGNRLILAAYAALRKAQP